jgi:hypothetical protein
MFFNLYFLGFLLVLAVHRSNAFPQYLSTTHCHVAMEAGVVMMGQTVVDSEKRSIKVTSKDGKQITSGEVISSLDDVEVSLEPKMMHAAFEVQSSENAVRFDGGSCDKKNRTWKQGILEYVGDGSKSTTVTIVSTWGSSANVYTTKPFSFTYDPMLKPSNEL